MPVFVRSERHDDIAVLFVENPPVNALSPGVPEAIAAALASAIADASVRAVILAGAGRTFVAGADIHVFSEAISGSGSDPTPYLASLAACARAIEDSPRPVVMAIHGAAFGAGLEIALAGHYRLIAASAQIGQPEVKLGLIPGAGGTQRLPRLSGVGKALEMCALGEAISAQDALASGIVDRIITNELIADAIRFAREIADKPILKTCDRTENLQHAELAIGNAMRAKVREALPGQTAPLLAIDAVEAAATRSFEEGIRREAELFDQCLHSPQAGALMYLFFAERTASKVPDVPPATRPLDDLAQANIILRIASNLPSRDFAGGLPSPEGVICVEHPGNRLMEIVRGVQATPESVRTAMEFAKKRGKVGVVSRDFIGARMFRLGSQDEWAFEGARILQDGLALRGSDIDVVCVLGYGFPAWRGGPMYAASIGPNKKS